MIENLQRMGRIPVFLLKTKSVPNDGYEERLEEVRYNVVKFMDEGVKEVKKFLRDRDIGKEDGKKYGGLIFTSQRAVELFAKLVEEGRQDGNVMNGHI
ncbi:hypothetical protein EYC80_007643 [Monilinia laxa]|uniref:Hydroxymethylbilane hydrolyase [cyclizing] n=1 Tax=Monilinia laxa TaxID=61186 RepID=A0A5N6JWK1_MONLA|nr:hypothetical protein EYC80_007643 [Monilinia laxa]